MNNGENATLAGVASNQLDRLQSVMNAAARLVCSARKCDHVTPLLQDLHWLRVPQRIEFKRAMLAFRCLHGMATPSTLHKNCAVWQTWTRYGDFVPLRRSSWTFHQRVVSPSVTVLSQSLQLAFGAVCRLTSLRRHRCPSSSDGWRRHSSAVHLIADWTAWHCCFYFLLLLSALEVFLTVWHSNNIRL